MNVLAISIHPDDETLGCGGTLLNHRTQGDDLSWLIVTQGFEPIWSADLLQRKANEVERVASAYGMEHVFKLGFHSTTLDTVAQSALIDKIRPVIEQVKPEIVYLVHDGDIHTDHHSGFLAVMSIIKTFYMKQFGVRRLLCYETLSSTDAAPAQIQRAFIPTVFSDVSSQLERKMRDYGTVPNPSRSPIRCRVVLQRSGTFTVSGRVHRH